MQPHDLTTCLRLSCASRFCDAEAASRAKSEPLANMSHEIRTPMNAIIGAEAVEAVARGGTDLVLMDLRLPGMSGLEAAAEIRRRGIDVPFVAVTAQVLVGERERCLEVGMNGFVAKPIDARVSVAAIAAAVGDRVIARD